MPKKRATFRIGTSGYQYEHWRGVFYPDGLPKNDWFAYYTEHFDTVEINNTFYQLPSPATFDSWRRRAPRGFCYALKFSRYGTHMKKLKDPRESIATFLGHAQRLGGSLGPLLVQLPPHWSIDPDRLNHFLDAAPRTHRWAVEFRDESWLCPDVYEVLRRHWAALCIHDLLDDHPWQLTADWLYLRFHGIHYGGAYSRQRLTAVAEKLAQALSEGFDVYAYFNNDAQGYAVANAADLARYVRARTSPPRRS